MQPTNVDAAGATISADAQGSDLPIAQGGQLLANRYEILRLIGTGGMGRVYRVRDRELDEIVALKMLRHEILGSDEMLDRFRQEVKLARRVTHRNVARMFDIGEHAGERFLTMELIDGEALAETLARRGALPIAEALALARDICSGMAAAHGAGVIHRDLKPENVLVTPDARAVVTDFGIARVDAADGAGRTGGRIVGTPAYMAPEQLHSAPIDGRADIYAFGAVLFEMITGARAWPGDAPLVVAAARLLDDPPDPRQGRAGIPDRVAEIVLRCMAREPAQRFQTAGALAEALEAAAAARVSITAPNTEVAALVRGLSARAKAVAVLSFRNAGPPDDAYLAEGLTDDLTDLLSMTQGLRVRARSGPADRGASDDVADLGRKLGVDVIIDGSVRRAGDQLRVSVRLISADDGFQIWAARFERSVGAALALNDDVARAVATALSTQHVAPARATETDPVAIELYLRARREGQKFWAADRDVTMQLFRDALDRAPNNPTILAGYVGALAVNFFLKFPSETLDPLVAQSIRAAPHLGEPWVALARVRFNARDDAPGAMRALRRALANAPGLADAHDMAGRMLLECGEIAQGTARLEHALWLDPWVPHTRIDLMRGAALQGRWDRYDELRSERTDDGWAVPSAISVKRTSIWRRLPPEQQPLLELPAETGDFQLHYQLLLNAIGRTGVLTAEHRALLSSSVGSVPANGRARRLRTQLAAEMLLFVRDYESGLAMALQSAEHGLLDLLWLDRMPLFEPVRDTAVFRTARAIVAARTVPILEAWAGPPEPLPI